jgi:hypothetical protein
VKGGSRENIFSTARADERKSRGGAKRQFCIPALCFFDGIKPENSCGTTVFRLFPARFL